MKKILARTMAIIVLIALIMPVTLYARVNMNVSHNLTKSEMEVGEFVEVTVKLDKEAEAIQFDLSYDDNVFEYVLNSSKSKLTITNSNPYVNGIVRTFALSRTGSKTDTVTLKFKALSEATNSSFTVSNLEADGDRDIDPSTATVTVKKIKSNGKSNGKDKKKRLPDTGVTDVAPAKKSIAGIYNNILSTDTQRVYTVLYALPDSDDVLTAEDITSEFSTVGTVDVSTIDNPIHVGTGEQFSIDGNPYTVILYGDTNGDGNVSVYDALLISNHERNLPGATLTGAFLEAADVKNDGNITGDDITNGLEWFILKKVSKNQGNKTKTVIDKYPPKFTANDISVTDKKDKAYRFETTSIATIKSTGSYNLTKDLISFTVSGPASATCVAEEILDENNAGTGVFKINFKPTKTTGTNETYTITPIIQGNEVDGKKITCDPIQVKVEEVYTITSITLYDGNTELNDVTVGMDTVIKPTIKYWHDYENGTKVEVKGDDISTVELLGSNPRGNLTTAQLYDAQNNAVTTTTQKPAYIQLEAYQYAQMGNDSYNAVTGTEDLTIKVTHNAKYAGTYGYGDGTKNITLTVTVGERQNADEILINGENPSNIAIPLYTGTDAGNVGATVTYNGQTFNIYKDTKTSKVYTILDITAKSNGKALTLYDSNMDISKRQLKKTEKVVFCEKDSASAGNTDIEIIFLVKTQNVYEVVDNKDSSTDKVNAIGIAVKDTGDTAAIESIGITLAYGGEEKATMAVKVNPVAVASFSAKRNSAPAATPTTPATPAPEEVPAPTPTTPVTPEPEEEPEPTPTTPVTPVPEGEGEQEPTGAPTTPETPSNDGEQQPGGEDPTE